MEKFRWFQNLSAGMNQSINTSLVENNESPHLENVTLQMPGVWASRKGLSHLGNTTTTSDGVWGLESYEYTSSGVRTRKLVKITQRDLYVYNEGSSSWGTAVDTDEWPADTRVNGVNFLNRLYLGSEDGATPLSYTTGSTITDITPAIGGHCLAVNRNSLAVGGNSIKPNIIFYTNPYTDTFHSLTATVDASSNGTNIITTSGSDAFEARYTKGGILYNTTDGQMARVTKWNDARDVTIDTNVADTWDTDTVYLMMNSFEQEGACTGIVGYEQGFVSFDEDNMYVWDPLSTWHTKYPGFGCTSHRSIQVINGFVVWVGREGLNVYANGQYPENITKKINNSVTGEGIWNLFSKANLESVSSGSRPRENIWVISLGDLSTNITAPASAKTNVQLEVDLTKFAFTINTYPSEAVVFTSFTNTDGERDLYYGEADNAAVFRMYQNDYDILQDDTQENIELDFRSPHYVLGDQDVTRTINQIVVRYKATDEVVVDISTNKTQYVPLGTLPASNDATIVRVIHPKANIDGYSHSLRFVTNDHFELEGFGFSFEEEGILRDGTRD